MKFLWLISWLIFCFDATAQFSSKNFIANTKAIDSLLSSTYNDSLPGASIGIMNDDKIIFQKNYGVSNIGTHQKLSAASNFNIASLTKQFTAIAILQLVHKHLLSTDDKLSRFFPDMNKKVADAVTIQELLTHTSGIVDHYDYTDTKNMKHAHNIDVYNAIKNNYSTYFKAGTQFRYSNTAYCLLALVIERLSGKTYNEYMQRNIFKPAGMLHTTIWNEKATITDEVTGYDLDSTSSYFIKSGADEHIFFSTEGDGGIYTSVNDYMQWFKALRSAKVCNAPMIAEARSVQFLIDNSTHTGYGYGWFVNDDEAPAEVYHSGDNGGFKTFSFSIPSLNYLVVIFSNRSDTDVEKLVQKIVQLQWPGTKPFIKIEALTS